MKKGLLLTLAIGTTLGATAQNTRMVNRNAKMDKAPTTKIGHDVSNPLIGRAPIKGIVNSPLMVSSTVALGDAPNAYGSAGGARTNLWADPSINAVAYTHRILGTTGAANGRSGFVAFDISTNGGANWTTNQIAYHALGLFVKQDSSTARYPLGLISNPAGNTNPANASYSYFVPTRDNSNPAGAGDWGGMGYGTAMLDGTMANQANSFSGFGAGATGATSYLPEDLFVTRQGTTWATSLSYDGTSGSYKFNDTLLIWKNSVVTGVPNYTLKKLPIRVLKDGTRGVIQSPHIAFDETGMIGWISFLGALPDSVNLSKADSSSYIVLLKSTDGGSTWGTPKTVIPATFSQVKDSLPSLNSANGEIGVYGTSFDMDLVVDKFGNPHVQTGVGVSVKGDVNGPNPSYNSFSFASGNAGEFAFYSTDGGVTFKAKYLARLATLRGDFGPSGATISEDNRPAISVSWDGLTIIHTWFDTDTVAASLPAGQNLAPDVHSLGLKLNPACEIWGSKQQNLTPVGKAGAGEVIQGNVSYYLLPGVTPGTYNVPVSYSQLAAGGDPAGAVQFQYLHNLEYYDVALLNACQVGIKDVTNIASVTLAPNPTTGLTVLSYNLTANTIITAEIYNILGEKLAVIANENQVAGKHDLNIDLSKYNNGLYVVRMNVNGVNTTVKIVKN